MDVTNEPEKAEEKVEEVVIEKKEEEESALEEKPLPKTYQKDVTYQSNRTISRGYGGSAYSDILPPLISLKWGLLAR